MNRLSIAERARVLAVLCEGMGVRPAVRATGVSKNAIQRLIRSVGPACQRLHDERVRGLSCRRVECDEAWAFVYAKRGNVPPSLRGNHDVGDVWLWAAIEADTKAVLAWYIGRRDRHAGYEFLCDLAARIEGSFDLNTDAHKAYESALLSMRAFLDVPDGKISHAEIVKVYRDDGDAWRLRNYTPRDVRVVGVDKRAVYGVPDMVDAGTSYAERANLTTRMHNKKMARASNGHAKKIEMLRHTTAIQYAYYNWVRPHMTLKGRTPAMASGLTDHRWTLEEIAALADAPVETSK